MFWNGTAEVEGNVKFCEQYGADADTCLRCIHSHSLMVAKADSEIPIDQNLLTSSLKSFYTTNNTKNKHFCMRTELDKCLNSSFVAQTDASVDNRVQCTQCQRNHFVDARQTNAFVVNNIQHFKIAHCKHQVTHKLYSLSTF